MVVGVARVRVTRILGSFDLVGVPPTAAQLRAIISRRARQFGLAPLLAPLLAAVTVGLILIDINATEIEDRMRIS